MENKTVCILYFITAAVSYATAAINFFGPNNFLGIMWLGIGTVWLCLGIIALNKMKKTK